MTEGQELQTTQGGAIQIRETVTTIKSRVQLVQHVMRETMKNGIHYGTIPGTPKPTLFKPGAEIIGLSFQLAPRYTTHDLSRPPELIHYRVSCELYHQVSGDYIGSGQGEASSDEEKYRWRKAICKEEFEATPEDRRRTKWAKGKGGSVYTIEQVRMEPADIGNTVLKMATKRAFIDAIRTASGCSDMFAQDLEDLPAEVRDSVTEEGEALPAEPIGDADWKKLVKQGKRFGYSEEDIRATAATLGHEGAGPDLPENVAQRLYQGMKSNPKSEEVDTETGEITEAPDETRGYRTPFPADD